MVTAPPTVQYRIVYILVAHQSRHPPTQPILMPQPQSRSQNGTRHDNRHRRSWTHASKATQLTPIKGSVSRHQTMKVSMELHVGVLNITQQDAGIREK
eukprot:6407575-Prymnesium_polylepis.2